MRAGWSRCSARLRRRALGPVRCRDAARSQESNFAGSIQTNYMGVPTDPDARKQALDGFTNELSLKVAVDLTDHVSANVKLCYGCHGVEVGMAFVDLRVADELNFRVGRFTPAFGDFPLRHDPANHRTSDKPLPYDMGRMLRLREWNMGVLPAPYVDQGIEINGTHWFGERRPARLRGVRGRRPARGPGRRRFRLDRVALGRTTSTTTPSPRSAAASRSRST